MQARTGKVSDPRNAAQASRQQSGPKDPAQSQPTVAKEAQSSFKVSTALHHREPPTPYKCSLQCPLAVLAMIRCLQWMTLASCHYSAYIVCLNLQDLVCQQKPVGSMARWA